MDNNMGSKNADIGRCAVKHAQANLTANILPSATKAPDSLFTVDPDPTKAATTVRRILCFLFYKFVRTDLKELGRVTRL
jgi:hypothetical protein